MVSSSPDAHAATPMLEGESHGNSMQRATCIVCFEEVPTTQLHGRPQCSHTTCDACWQVTSLSTCHVAGPVDANAGCMLRFCDPRPCR